MHLIKLPDYDWMPFTEANLIFKKYIEWLNANAGEQKEGWDWATGDGYGYARGVYIKSREIAILFRLRFGL